MVETRSATPLNLVKSREDERREQLPPRNPLSEVISERIRQNGPIRFHEYMDIWLNGVTFPTRDFIPGYYNGTDVVIGDSDEKIDRSRVDFYTSPEISPVFGFLTARQILEMREHLGNPHDFTIVEMGAGNGTWAHDILYGIKHYDAKALESTRYIILEKSHTLAKKQQERLSQFPEFHFEVRQASATEIPLENITGVFISNELPDAFPASRVRRKDREWQELYIAEGDQFRFQEAWKKPQGVTQQFLERFQPLVKDNEIYPVNTDSVKWVAEVGRALKQGYVMTIDYDRKNEGLELYASREKNINVDDYLNKAIVGKSDMSNGVDFQALADAGVENGLYTTGFVSQRAFLYELHFHVESAAIGSRYPQIGDRTNNFYRAEELLYPRYTGYTGYNVLVQHKNVQNPNALEGLLSVRAEIENHSFHPLRNQVITQGMIIPEGQFHGR